MITLNSGIICPSIPASCISDNRAYRPRRGLRKFIKARRWVGVGKNCSDGEAPDVLLHAGERIVGHRAFAIDGRLEQTDPGLGSAGGALVVDEPHAVGRAHQIGADRRGGGSQRPAQRAVDGAGVAKIVAHQALDPLPHRPAAVAEQLGGPLLQLMAEQVVMTLGFEVQRRADPEHELFGVAQGLQAGAALSE